jgi:hypothetical protein
MNRDGTQLISSGKPETHAQPPCLLRFSPKLFAEECPTMFAYDEGTNTLSLQPGRHPPWVRKTFEQDRSYIRDSTKTWTYCTDCKARWCPDTAQRSKAFLPFRDRASQINLRPHKPYKAADPSSGGTQPSQSQQSEPEHEPEGGADAFIGDVDMPDDGEDEPIVLPMTEAVPDAPDAEAYPTLTEYRAQWAARLAMHSRPTGGQYSNRNLVPKPVQNLWQDCPMTPFDDLKSEEAQARLSCCRPVSAFTPSSMKEGVPRYSPQGVFIQKPLHSLCPRACVTSCTRPPEVILLATCSSGGAQRRHSPQ